LIEREDDQRLDPYRHVGDPHWLEARGLFVAEGRLVVERVIDYAANSGDGRYQIESILVTPAAHRALEPRLASRPDVHIASQSIVNGVTGFNFHRGCLALVRRPPDLPVDSIVALARSVVVLEGVGNPDNIGGIFRSAAAFGAEGVLLDPVSADPWYRKAIRTSMGAVLRLPFARLTPWPQALAVLRQHGLVTVALSPSGKTTLDRFCAGLDAKSRVALMAGAEGPGLSDAATAQADVTIRIPVDPWSDSLNVVVAVSIALASIRSATAGSIG
jgi:tRNA G18 (ribose-2'-O)-methylase SpoU